MSASVSSVVASYLRYLERQNRAGAFSTDHLSMVRHYLKRFEEFVSPDKEIADCRQKNLSAWLAANETRWLSVCTQRNAVSAVLGCFRYAAEEDSDVINPFHVPRSLRGATAKPRRPATKDEYLQLFRHGSRPLRWALFFLRETGARTCEMREALWTDITIEERPCIVLYTHKTHRKTGKSRTIALNSVVHRFLIWLRKRSRSPHVFTNCDGGTWDRHTFARHLRRTAERIGLDDDVAERVTAYCLRHTFACDALDADFTTKQVADQLGHVDTKMVERVYGSHTRKNMPNLNRVADDIRRRRA